MGWGSEVHGRAAGWGSPAPAGPRRHGRLSGMDLTPIDPADQAPIEVPETIVCVECRGTCHRLGHEPPDGWEEGDWVAYRCADCMDRFDLQVAVD